MLCLSEVCNECMQYARIYILSRNNTHCALALSMIIVRKKERIIKKEDKTANERRKKGRKKERS